MTNDGRYVPVVTVERVKRHRARHVKHRRGAPARRAAVQVPVEPSASPIIEEMRRYLGGNPTGWARVWCGKMLDIVLRATGHRPGSPRALDYARYGRVALRPEPGVIVVWRHHVGVVTAVGTGGRVRVISGNDGHRVRERWRSTKGAVALRWPS